MELAFARRNGQELGGIVSDARTGKRFPLELPIKIHKESESGAHSGATGNLSAAGVYIKADAALEVGSNVEFEITLPPEVTGSQTKRGCPMPGPGGAHRRIQRGFEGCAWRGLRDRYLRFRSPLRRGADAKC